MEKATDLKNLNITAKVEGYEDYGGVNYFIGKLKAGEGKDAAQWTIRKRFSEFVDLHKNLSIKHSEIPELPSKTWFKVSDPQELDNRVNALNEFLQTLCKREALSNDSDFRNFINLEENMHSKLHFNKEKMLYKFPDVNLGIREFIVVEEQKIVMAVCSEENLQNRIMSYWDNIKIPFLSDNQPSSTVGGLAIYKIISQDPWRVEEMFFKSFKAQATCVHFDKSTNFLAVGLASGKIRIFEIPKNFKFVKGVVYESSIISAHSSQVTGVCMDPVLGYVYSIGRDGKFCASDRTSCELYWSKQFDRTELTSMYHDDERKRIFIGDNSGFIHVYSIKKYPPKRLTSIKTSVKVAIKSITCSKDHNKLFAGTSEGEILCFNLGGYGKEKKETQEYTYSLKGKSKCISLCWDESSQGLLSGNESGNVAAW